MKFTIYIAMFILFSCKAKPVASPEYVLTGYYSYDEIKELEWFKTRYDNYTPDDSIVNLLARSDKNIFIQVFAGSWCGDTHKLLPRYFKTADMAEIKNHQVYFVDRQKKSPDGLEKNYNIEFVPTFIVFKDGSEIGRIVESTEKSIEADLWEIIKNT